jgi:hypothetical protein
VFLLATIIQNRQSRKVDSLHTALIYLGLAYFPALPLFLITWTSFLVLGGGEIFTAGWKTVLKALAATTVVYPIGYYQTLRMALQPLFDIKKYG